MTGPVVVVGAGVAGLTIAHQLATRGVPVTVIERNPVVGGLARTFHYGDFHFDVGPHRFHTDSRRVEQYIRSVLADDAIEIRRTSGARMFGRIHEWPLRPSILLSMPIDVMLRATRDLFARGTHDGESFEADILSKYGHTLYEIFFKPYTEKFLFHDPRVLHRDWARAGVNRAVIDKRAASDSLVALLKTTLLPRPVDTTFLYAAHGVGRFSDRLAEIIQAHGGRIVLGAPVERVEAGEHVVEAVHANGERFPARQVIWTAPITVLNQQLGIEGIDLEFLSTIFFNIELSQPSRLSYQWTYFGGDEIFSRVTSPSAFAPTTVPPGKGALCVELTCRQGDERWQTPTRHIDHVIADLVRTGSIERAAEVERVHIETVPETYPIYKLNYAAELRQNLAALGRYRNLLTAGRCGRFWYNNMDHSIGQGLTMADRILRGDALAEIDGGPREFWQADGR